MSGNVLWFCFVVCAFLVNCIICEIMVTNFVLFRENQQIREKKTKIRRLKRYAIIGAATGLGGVLIGKSLNFFIIIRLISEWKFAGVTGGLAAPFIVSSLSALTATTIFAGLTTTATAAIFGSLFGVAGISS